MELIVDFPRVHRQEAPLLSRLIWRKGVRFAETIRVKFVDNLAIKHKAGLFYSHQELIRFKQQIARQVRLLETIRAGCDDMSEYARLLAELNDAGTLLGLERLLTDSTCWEIERRRRAHVRAVILEQRRQASLGICDVETMASISEAESGLSRKRARLVGLLNASSEV